MAGWPAPLERELRYGRAMRLAVALAVVLSACGAPSRLDQFGATELRVEPQLQGTSSGFSLALTLTSTGDACPVVKNLGATLDDQPMTTVQQPSFSTGKGSRYTCANSRLGLCKEETFDTATCLPAIFSGALPSSTGSHRAAISDGTRTITFTFGTTADGARVVTPQQRDRLSLAFSGTPAGERSIFQTELSVGSRVVGLGTPMLNGGSLTVPISESVAPGVVGTITLGWRISEAAAITGAAPLPTLQLPSGPVEGQLQVVYLSELQTTF